jgi:hypothetical protein
MVDGSGIDPRQLENASFSSARSVCGLRGAGYAVSEVGKANDGGATTQKVA